MIRLISFFIFIVLIATSATASERKYWIYLKDKDLSSSPAISDKTIQNRTTLGLSLYDETDLPVKTAYIDSIRPHVTQFGHPSKWLNAVAATLTSQQVYNIKQLAFVTEVVPMDTHFFIASTHSVIDKTQLEPVLKQVQADVFVKEKLTGKGIGIGVVDAGFFGADSSSYLKQLFKTKRILGVKDYVKPYQPAELLFTSAESFSDMHGTEVLAAIAGHNPKENKQSGMALNANFYLARTDYSQKEWRGEEDNWIAAIEWLDSLGVRLVNTSLGYARGFSDPKENYQTSQIDGKTTNITKAAQIASDKKGMLLIVSAGNEGEDKDWKIVTAPADAQGVLTVGATNEKLWTRIGYSSIGPEELPYLKPNVACHSLYGTSLSAPVITGFAACLMELAPHLSNKELIQILEKSAHLYPYGNNQVGYGVPQASIALALIKTPYLPSKNYKINAKGKSVLLKVKTSDNTIAIYRKKNNKDVLSQYSTQVINDRITIKRQNNEAFTTVDLKNYAIEIAWE